MQNEIETKRNETKFIETKRNLPKRNEIETVNFVSFRFNFVSHFTGTPEVFSEIDTMCIDLYCDRR
jgi:hypothetical protein